MSPQDAVKLVDWILSTQRLRTQRTRVSNNILLQIEVLTSSGAKEQTQRIKRFDLASSGSKEQIEVVTQRPWMRRNRVFKFRRYSNLASFGAKEQICYRLAVRPDKNRCLLVFARFPLLDNV
ncbi:hypothetical protein GQ457_03G012920 [Hibiscus cannabinus]